MIGAKNFTALLVAENEALFIVEEQTTIPKPQNSNQKIKALSDENMGNIDEIHEIMHNNREFE